jgi:uncharacterized protein with HEPN domain
LIHAYFGIDWNEVWKAALRREVTNILAGELGGPAAESDS